MQPVCLISLGDETFSGHIIGEYLAETDPAYTPNLDVMYFNQHWGSNDANCHRHSQEEYIFVLQGQIDQLVNHQFVSTGPGQLTCIRAGVPHKIIHVQAPVVNFLFHVPGGKIERVYYPDCADGPEEGIRPEKSVFQVDMRRDFQSHLDYRSFPVGACLPEDHPNYSPYLDFTCAWGADPAVLAAARTHQARSVQEEYYFVLRGRLDFKVDGAAYSLFPKQVLGIRPPAVHRVAGGSGPVDVLYLRVPGGNAK